MSANNSKDLVVSEEKVEEKKAEWFIDPNTPVVEAEKAIEDMVLKAIDELESIKGLFAKEKAKMGRVVQVFKILGGYLHAIHIERQRRDADVGETKDRI